MKCPKCHFEQPQDNYCANCGIEIASYHPPKVKWTQRFFTQKTLLIGSIVLVASFAINAFLLTSPHSLGLRQSHPSNSVQLGTHPSEPSLDPQNSASQIASPNADTPSGSIAGAIGGPSESSDSTASNSINNTNNLGSPPNENGGGGRTESLPQSMSTEGLNSNSTKIRGSLPAKNNLSVKIIYAEINTSDLPQIYEESQTSGQFTSYMDHSVGVLSNYAAKIGRKDSPFKIYFTEDKEIELGKTHQWFVGTISQPDNAQVGLIFHLEWTGTESSGGRSGSLEVARNWRDTTDPSLVTTNFPPISFELDKSSALFISGLIPHRVASELEERLGSVEALKVLRFSPFLKQQTESIIILEFLDK